MTAAVRDYYEPLGVPRDSCSAGELASATVVGLWGNEMGRIRPPLACVDPTFPSAIPASTER